MKTKADVIITTPIGRGKHVWLNKPDTAFNGEKHKTKLMLDVDEAKPVTTSHTRLHKNCTATKRQKRSLALALTSTLARSFSRRKPSSSRSSSIARAT